MPIKLICVWHFLEFFVHLYQNKECGQEFKSTSFYEYNGMPYCKLHYHNISGSFCHACHQPINGRCISAMSKKFHPEHFSCSFCLCQLKYDLKGTFKEQAEKPYCNSCFMKLFQWKSFCILKKTMYFCFEIIL